MSSIFGLYNVAVSGMYVNQTALTVTSQNISNINTTGYSRQIISTQETVVAVKNGVSAGSGASIQDIGRARNVLLDQTYRQQNSKLGYWQTKSGNLEDAQVVLNEFGAAGGDTGLQQAIAEFFTGWDELAKDPGSLTNRQAVVDYAKSMLDSFSLIDEQLQQLQYDAASAVKDGIAELNSLALQVAELNNQIQLAEISGVEASELRDQRDILLDSMSGLANITVCRQNNGTVQVNIGGVALVSGGKTHALSAAGDGSSENPLVIQWADLAEPVLLTGGSIAANLADADQSGVQAIASAPYNYSAQSNSSIGSLRQGLNALLTAIVHEVNSLHSAGTGLDGSSGLDFFLPNDAAAGISCSTIAINPVLQADTSKIAAGTGGESGDNSTAAAIAALTESPIIQYDGQDMNINEFYQALTAWLGAAGGTAGNYAETQAALVAQVENSRQSISAVSLDEELANMLMFQNAYSANARVLSTIDGLLADLIAELG